MAQQIINIGAIPGDKTGDTLRTGGQKINANFAELYTKVANTFIPVQTGNSGRALYTDGATITWRDVKTLTNQNFIVSVDDYGALTVPTHSQYASGYITSLNPDITIGSTQVSGSVVNNWFLPSGTTTTSAPSNAINSKTLVQADGVWAQVQTASNTYSLQFNTSGQLSLPSYILPNTTGVIGQVLSWPGSGNVLTWITPYTLPTASTSVLGGVKIDGTTVTLNGSNQLVATQYSLPTATTSILGGVKIDGTTITISGGVISAANQAAAAGTLTGTTLKSTVVSSSLTSVGTLTGLTVSGTTNLSTVSTTGLTLRSINFIAVGSTATYALSTTVSYNVLVVSTTALTATITLPPSPVDQQLVSFTVASNTVTLAMTAGPTVVPAFAGAGIVSGTVFQYVYRSSNSTWYRN